MQDIFYYSVAVSVMYFLIKVLELRYSTNDDEKPLKNVLKDAFIVFVSSFAGIYILNQFMLNGLSKKTENSVFIDNPGF